MASRRSAPVRIPCPTGFRAGSAAVRRGKMRFFLSFFADFCEFRFLNYFWIREASLPRSHGLSFALSFILSFICSRVLYCSACSGKFDLVDDVSIPLRKSRKTVYGSCPSSIEPKSVKKKKTIRRIIRRIISEGLLEGLLLTQLVRMISITADLHTD